MLPAASNNRGLVFGWLVHRVTPSMSVEVMAVYETQEQAESDILALRQAGQIGWKAVAVPFLGWGVQAPATLPSDAA